MSWLAAQCILKTADALINAQRDRLAADLEAQRKQIKDEVETKNRQLAAEAKEYKDKIDAAGKARAEEVKAMVDKATAKEG